MPRPEQTPPARFSGLPYGTNALVNSESEEFNDIDDSDDEILTDEEDFQPANDDEAFLFSGTDRPDEPITAGMGFGPGPGIASQLIQDETPPAFANRVLNEMQAAGESSPGLKKFIDKARRGL